MPKSLRVSPDLVLPADVVTSTTVVYGGKGMGKTNFGSVLIEELTKAGLRWCLLDPMGVSWGLRHSKDGAGKGIECVVLGGAHGDIPIEPTGGAIVADLVVDEGVNTIIDFSRRPNGKMWSNGERVRFVTEYTIRLFERQGELVDGHRREPLLQILDEAARYIPQVIPHGSLDLAKCVGAWEQVCEEGRNIGLGVAFLTQRSARMNKSVSELADVMIAFRTIGPNSLEAVMDWLGHHIEKARIRDLAAQVRELDIGQALVVSPGWLKVEKIARIRERETFDSSATPKAGEKPKRVTGPAAKPDLAKYQARMVDTIEKAKADDPKELRKEIARLKKELTATAPSSTSADPKLIEREVQRAVSAERAHHQQVVRALVSGAKAARHVAQEAQVQAENVVPRLTVLVEELGKIIEGVVVDQKDRAPISAPVSPLRPLPATSKATRVEARSGASGVSGPQQRMLNAMAMLAAIRIDRAPRTIVAAMSNQSPSSSGFEKNMSTLRTLGYLHYPDADSLALTPEGTAVADPGRTPLSLADLHASVRDLVSGPQWRMLEALIAAYPDAMARGAVAAQSNQSSTSSGFEKNLSTLRTLGFISYPSSADAVATEWLMPRELR